MRYPIIIHPDDKLRKPCEPITVVTDELVQLLDDMYETMIAHDGIGIAAPQIGKNIQVAVIEIEEGDRFELINPVILEAKGAEVDVEGCLSIPHVYGTVERADEVTVRYFDREGEEMEVQAFGYLARAFQHEIDHLQGQLFTDKMIKKIPEDELETYMEEHAND
ncbi:peptide deformylase [Enterococcus olivae]